MSTLGRNTQRKLRNEEVSLTVDLFGGAITDFHLHCHKINPLTFAFSKEQMPDNNKGGAPYQGHFLCLGRWGTPSPGEKKAGIPDHGQIANILWNAEKPPQDHTFHMQVSSPLEGLRVERTLRLDHQKPVYMVREEVTNINPLGRLYQMVQHPTLAAPFLDQATIIYCNADKGYNYVFSQHPEKHQSVWPDGLCEDLSLVNLSRPEKPYTSVFSFIVKKEATVAWVVACSPTHHFMLGYVWKRSHYPWINFWLDWSAGQIRYRGLEFGTTGMHQPFHQILEAGHTHLFGEKTIAFLDAGEKVSRSYLSFLLQVSPGFKGVEDIRMEGNQLLLQEINQGENMYIDTTFDLDTLLS